MNTDSAADPWARLGFEVELLLPVGQSRLDLANIIARQAQGSVRRSFHADTEPSLVEGRPVFHHLTAAFDVYDRRGVQLCRLVDDVTIQTDLDSSTRAPDGWFRIVSDDRRLISLIGRHADPSAAACDVLTPIAELFGTNVEMRDGGRYRLNDAHGASISIVTPQTGERERVCEVITPPLSGDMHQSLDQLLSPAKAVGCTIPTEAAVHVHLDAEPFRSPALLAALVTGFSGDRDALWETLGTNRACRRLGALPDELVKGVGATAFADQTWVEIEAWLRSLSLTKYCDLNLTNLVRRPADKDTVEIRLLPGALDATSILRSLDRLRNALGL